MVRHVEREREGAGGASKEVERREKKGLKWQQLIRLLMKKHWWEDDVILSRAVM